MRRRIFRVLVGVPLTSIVIGAGAALSLPTVQWAALRGSLRS
jgi:hypothetical protein